MPAVRAHRKSTVLPRIQEAALSLFVHKGIEATTTKDIARRARVSEGALYRHYKGKYELAWDIFSVHLKQFSEKLKESVEKTTGTRNQIRVFVRESFAAFEADPVLFSYLILSEHRELKKFPAQDLHPGRVALDMVSRGMAARQLRRRDDFVGASLLVGTIIRLCVVRMNGHVSGGLGREADGVAEAIWLALKK